MVRVKQLDVELGHPQDQIYEVDVEPIRQRKESRGSYVVWKAFVGGQNIMKTHQGERHAVHIVRKMGFKKGKWSVKVRRIRGENLKYIAPCVSEIRK